MLLGVFILQHSAMKRSQLKERLQNAKLGHLERSLYVGSTNICLLVLINFWSTSSSMLWQLDFDIRIFSWVHCLSWGLIYCSALLLVVRHTMTLDRALLATVLISYMYLAWNPDLEDLKYQKAQWRRKKVILRDS